MFSVIFEVHPKQERFELYLALAKNLRQVLEGIDGFIDNERFESKLRPGWILSHSTWRDEKSVVRWRTVAKRHETQQRGRDEVFQDYRLGVGEVVADTTPRKGQPLVEQRLDETGVGVGKYTTLTEVSPAPDAAGPSVPSEFAERLALDRGHPALIDHDVFVSIYNTGKLALLASWRDRGSAEAFAPPPLDGSGTVRHRVVGIVRDYGMFDRRESPQYYPDIERGPAIQQPAS